LDGRESPDTDLDQVRDVAERYMVIEPWQPGDGVAIDDHSTSHGRRQPGAAELQHATAAAPKWIPATSSLATPHDALAPNDGTTRRRSGPTRLPSQP
jgi:hypothetical protein